MKVAAKRICLVVLIALDVFAMAYVSEDESPVRRQKALSRVTGELGENSNMGAAAVDTPGEVVVCRGVGDMDEAGFREMGMVWSRYVQQKIVTGTSPLLYRIMPDGSFSSYGDRDGKNYELWSHKYLSPPGAKLIPHVFCDSTCCDTCQLPTALQNAMNNRKHFFAQSVEAAKKYGWDGYAMDFEGSMPPVEDATQFFKEWREELAKHTGRAGKSIEMHLWSPSGLNEDSINPHMDAMVTMSTYSYSEYSASMLEGSKRNLASDSRGLSWRSRRKQIMMEAGAIKSVCALNQTSRKQSVLVDRGQLKPQTSAARLQGLRDGMSEWCGGIKRGHGQCGIGLITYDLSNTNLKCTDMVNAARGGKELGMRSIWLWSGGIIPKAWEKGFTHFSTSRDQGTYADFLQGCDITTMVSDGPKDSSSCGCKFDGHYCCDGSSRNGM